MNFTMDDFRNLLRELFSEEHKEVPTDDNDISYTFSKRFTKRSERLIKKQKSFYWYLINRLWKKFLALSIILSLIAGAFLHFHGTSPSENESNTPTIPQEEITADNNDNFPFYSSVPILDDDGNTVGEIFSDKKASIFNSMINSFYYFDRAHLTVDLALSFGPINKIEYVTDMRSGASNENVFVGGNRVAYSYSDGRETLFVGSLDHNEYSWDKYPIFLKENEKYIPLNNRFIKDSNGNISFRFANNVTNCPNAEYCLLPQGLAFEYLSNFDLWEIDNANLVVFDRHCIGIRGKRKDEEFNFIVDSATGILMRYEIIYKGEIQETMRVTSCVIDGEAPMTFPDIVIDDDYYESVDEEFSENID